VKFDRQIVAIALVNGVQTIYSSDEDIAKYAKARGIAVTKLWELALPPAEQPSLPNMQPEGRVVRSDAAPEPGLSEAAGGENDEDGE
jgi:hypothetical protein